TMYTVIRATQPTARMPHRKKTAFITSSSHSAALWGLWNFRTTMAPEAESCCFIDTPMVLVEKAACSQKPPGDVCSQAERFQDSGPGCRAGRRSLTQRP